MNPGGSPLLLSHPACALHHAPGHPERPERLAAIEAALAADDRLHDLPRRQPEPATRGPLEAVHESRYVESIFDAGATADASGEGVWLDADTWLGPGSLEAALASAGGALAAVDAVLADEFAAAFSLTRPPGHHATAGRAMGFCFFNNIAAAAQAALDRGLERVAIVDFDVHHGNGSQDIFYERADVLYVSCHQSPLYPGTGATGERGRGEGEGFTINVPMAAGAGETEYLAVFDQVFGPALDQYQPQLLLLSAGFDAHALDPLAQMELTSEAYGALASRLHGWADELCDGRSVWVLEGGYDLVGLSEGVTAVVTELCAPRHSHSNRVDRPREAPKE
jgi:acetoin utilization deacetylase AcuC-like enzyme